MRKITYTLAALLALAFSIASCNKDHKDENEDIFITTEVNVGALLSLTGNWSSLGITSQAAIDIALQDINAYMVQTGSMYRFKSTIYDTKLDGALATQYIADAKAAKGCSFVLGPQSSAEAAAVKDFADGHEILVVSQGSTAGSLSLAGDNIFRFCPDDHIEGPALAKTIYSDGIRALVTAARDDAGNKGLQASVGTAFTAQGGNIAATTPYSNATAPDFTATLADIKAKLQQYYTTYPAKEIAVFLASFDECVALFQLAATDPIFSSVRWYGGDGTALSAAITGNAAAADFAIATQYFAPSFGLPADAAVKWQPLTDKIKAKAGLAPDAFALAAYDALWVMALSYNAFPYAVPTFAQLKAEFPAQAGRYFGATGATLLNSAGDRAIGSYDYWGIEKVGGDYKWIVVGKSE